MQETKKTNDFWLDHISQWKETDLLQSEYCKLHNLNEKKFSRIKIMQLNRTENMSQFIELPKKTPIKQQAILLKINDRHSIELHPNFSPELLHKILNVLESRL